MVLDTSVADAVFLICALVGGGLLLITVLLDDILGGLLDFLDFDLGGSSLMPILLSFVAMFGVGGLFGTQVLDLSAGMASVVGVVFGVVGGGLAWAMFRFLYRAVSDPPFSQEDLIGREAYVLVPIPRTSWGTIAMEVEGTTQQFRATSSSDIAQGEMVRITGIAGNGLIVEPETEPEAATEPPQVPKDQVTDADS